MQVLGQLSNTLMGDPQNSRFNVNILERPDLRLGMGRVKHVSTLEALVGSNVLSTCVAKRYVRASATENGRQALHNIVGFNVMRTAEDVLVLTVLPILVAL